MPLRAMVLSAALALACGPDERLGDPTIDLEVGVSPTPATIGSVRVLVATHDLSGAPLPVERLRITARPPEGSGAAPPPTFDLPGDASGQFAVPGLALSVRGDWVLEVRVDLLDGRWAMREQPIHVVGGG
jgi:hypothetical protein